MASIPDSDGESSTPSKRQHFASGALPASSTGERIPLEAGGEPLSATLRTGSRLGYRCLTSTEHYMGDFVRLCPEALLGRYLAVVKTDSGSPWLTDQQRTAGWQVRSRIVRSPRLVSTAELFYQRDGADGPGYDEWYLFGSEDVDMGEIQEGNPFLEENAPRPGLLMTFVGYLGFSILDPDPTWECFTTMFWDQLAWLQPESYISDGSECLTFVTRDEALFESVHQKLAGAVAEAQTKRPE